MARAPITDRNDPNYDERRDPNSPRYRGDDKSEARDDGRADRTGSAEDLSNLPKQTQEEIAAGKAALETAPDLTGVGYTDEPPPLTTFPPGEFQGQESAAGPVGTEPNPPEGVTALTHEPIEEVPVNEEEKEGLDAKERKELYEAQYGRRLGDPRPAQELVEERRAEKEAERQAARDRLAKAKEAQDRRYPSREGGAQSKPSQMPAETHKGESRPSSK